MMKIYLLIICLLLFFGQRAFGESVTQKVHFSQAELKCDTITGEDGLVYNLLSYQSVLHEYIVDILPPLPLHNF